MMHTAHIFVFGREGRAPELLTRRVESERIAKHLAIGIAHEEARWEGTLKAIAYVDMRQVASVDGSFNWIRGGN